ncbi:MAG: metallophosphoesterase [candidate division WOR-3 bacterium]|nr:metallophosphoesterase [candidate division WOR-3 bacterium]
MILIRRDSTFCLLIFLVGACVYPINSWSEEFSTPNVIFGPYLGNGNNQFSIAIIADPHVGDAIADYGTPGWNDTPFNYDQGSAAVNLRNTVNWINTHKNVHNIKYVFILGDLTESAEISELRKAYEILNTLQVPWIPLIGNHDVWPYIDANNKAPEELSDSYFNSIFGAHYDYLSSFLPNFRKCPLPIWNWEVNPGHYSYFQNFAFDAGYGDWHFICIDFNSRDDANNGQGVDCGGALYALNMNDKVSSIKVKGTNSKGVIVYEHSNPEVNEGKSQTFFNSTPTLEGSHIGNDNASAIRIIGDCTVRLHKDANYKGSIVRTSTDIPDLSSSAYQFNDRTSSIKITNAKLSGRLEVYKDANYGGRKEIFIASDRYLYGNYIGNDEISSFKIYGPCRVTFYKDANFSGASLTYDISANQNYFSPSMPSGWNDEVSSIKIVNCDSRGVIFYSDAGIDTYNNNQLTLFGNDADLSDNPTGWSYPKPVNWNDIISAVRIIGNCTVTLYIDSYYKGFLEATGPGFYVLENYNLNDEVSSIEVMNGYLGSRIELYKDENYGGKSEIMIFDDRNLDGNFIGNDEISSVKVYGGTGSFTCSLYIDAGYSGGVMELRKNDPRLSENGAYAWWRDHIRNYPNKKADNILIFAHHPLYVESVLRDDSSRGYWNFTIDEYNNIAWLLNEYKDHIGGWFAGHLHGYPGWQGDKTWSIKYPWGGFSTICNGYFTGTNKDNRGCIRLVFLKYTDPAIATSSLNKEKSESRKTSFTQIECADLIKDAIKLKINLLDESEITIKLFNSLGQMVRHADFSLAKDREINIDSKNLSAGVYFLKIETENYNFNKKIILLD